MIYERSITIPPNTPAEDPTRVDFAVDRGVIHYLEVEFPAGCAALAHLVIYYNSRQVFPSEADQDFASDNHVVQLNEYLPIDLEPLELSLRGWSDDDTYGHTLRVRVGLLRQEVLQPPDRSIPLLQQLTRLITGRR